MYHAIGEPGEPAARLLVPITTFKRQMACLARLRFPVVELETAVHMLGGGQLPRRAVSLTFDDGSRDLRTLALPVLQRYGFHATAFVVTGMMGSTVSWTEQRGLAGRPVVSWAEALELEPLVSVAPHTSTHRSLPDLDDDELAQELRASRADVEAHTGRTATMFAYPYGHYDERVVRAVSAAGFPAACTTRPGLNGPATPRHELRRHEVRGDRPLATFLASLVSGLGGP